MLEVRVRHPSEATAWAKAQVSGFRFSTEALGCSSRLWGQERCMSQAQRLHVVVSANRESFLLAPSPHTINKSPTIGGLY